MVSCINFRCQRAEPELVIVASPASLWAKALVENGVPNVLRYSYGACFPASWVAYADSVIGLQVPSSRIFKSFLD